MAKARLRTIAARLSVTPRSLRESIDRDDPHPSSGVVLAMVQYYGVDPMWLLTGNYDSATHRQALEEPASVARLLARTTLRLDLRDGLGTSDVVLRDGHWDGADRTSRVTPRDYPPTDHKSAAPSPPSAADTSTIGHGDGSHRTG